MVISMPIKVKRVYDPPEDSDGRRILVDRIWPRGIAKNKARVDEWMSEVAPSHQLRKWFGHREERWQEFQQRYSEELRSPGKEALLERLRSLSREKTITLLYAAKDTEHNNARVLAAFVSRMKPSRRSRGR
jgi:uncharacterized protein YeaO (DUF488 family)